jgi:hypothetical protein
MMMTGRNNNEQSLIVVGFRLECDMLFHQNTARQVSDLVRQVSDLTSRLGKSFPVQACTPCNPRERASGFSVKQSLNVVEAVRLRPAESQSTASQHNLLPRAKAGKIIS